MKLLNIRNLIYAGLFAGVLSSCLKGDPINLAPGATGNLISVAVNSNGVWQSTPLAVNAQTTDSTYNVILVTLSSAEGVAKEDIHVTMVPQIDSLPRYNSKTYDEHDPNTGEVTVAHPEKYLVAAGTSGSPAFTVMDNGVVTIPKGKNYGYLRVKTTSNNWLGSTAYAFVYRISTVQEAGYVISANNGYSITPFVVKNKYDAEYSVTGTLLDKASGSINGSCSYPMDVYLVTQGPSVVWLYDKAIPGYYHTICSGGGLSYYGNAGVAITFDANDNVISVDNIYQDPAPRSRTFQLDPSGVNKYDAATNTLKIKYWMNQANSVQPHRVYFDETFKFTGPR